MNTHIDNRCQTPSHACIHVWIYLNKVYEEVYMRSWWRGEAEKLKDPDATILQAPQEAADELRVFATTALNQVVLWGIELLPAADMEFFDDNRVPFFWVDLSTDNRPCDPSATVQGEMAKLDFASSRIDIEQPLRRAIFDYVVQYVLYKWSASVRPDLAEGYRTDIDEYAERLRNVLHLAAASNLRRRYRLMGI